MVLPRRVKFLSLPPFGEDKDKWTEIAYIRPRPCPYFRRPTSPLVSEMTSQLRPLFGNGAGDASLPGSRIKSKNRPPFLRARACQSADDRNRAFNQLGLCSLKKKIEDAIVRAEMLGLTALEIEEERRIRREAMMRDFDLWDDPAKSIELLAELADSSKLVDALKDLRYKAEEAKLITQLVGFDAIDSGLFTEAYDASVDVSVFLDQYEMSKLLRGTCDKQGACLIVEAGSEGNDSGAWAEQLLTMYTKWAARQGQKARMLEKQLSSNGGIKSAILELEFEYAYGYLLGERGVHCKIRSALNGFVHDEVQVPSAYIDVIPLFLGAAFELEIADEDLIISSLIGVGKRGTVTERAICIQHIPTGISVQSSGERSYFANKVKALNRLKAKLLVMAKEQGVSDIGSIKSENAGAWTKEVRRYVLEPQQLVQDVQTGLRLADLNSVLDGNIEPLIAAHINLRQY